METKIYDIVDRDTLRHRETAQMILQTINEKSTTSSVVLDFSGITFTSRSFMHELLSGLQERELSFVNTSAEVRFMIDNAFKKPVLRLEPVGKVKELVAS